MPELQRVVRSWFPDFHDSGEKNMNIKRFHPRQVISVPATLGVRRAESFAVGEQCCVSIDRIESDGSVLVVLNQAPGKSVALNYTGIGVVETVVELEAANSSAQAVRTTREVEIKKTRRDK